MPFWAPGVFGILLGLSDPCSRTRGGTGVRVVSCLCRFGFPFFVVFAASHARKPMPFWEVRLRLLPAPRESDPQGSPCGLWFGDHILGLVFAVSLLLLVGSRGPVWALFWGGCVCCPLRPSHARLAPRPLNGICIPRMGYRIPRAAPRIPRQYPRATPKIPRKTRRLPSPVFCLDFL